MHNELNYSYWNTVMDVLTVEPQTISEICAKLPQYNYQATVNMLNAMYRNDAVIRRGDKTKTFRKKHANANVTPPRQMVPRGTYMGIPMIPHRVGAMDAFSKPSRFNNRLESYWGASA